MHWNPRVTQHSPISGSITRWLYRFPFTARTIPSVLWREPSCTSGESSWRCWTAHPDPCRPSAGTFGTKALRWPRRTDKDSGTAVVPFRVAPPGSRPASASSDRQDSPWWSLSAASAGQCPAHCVRELNLNGRYWYTMIDYENILPII